MNNRTLGFCLSFLLLVPAVLNAATAGEYRDMGTALYQKGLYAKAADYFKDAVQADPNDWQSYQGLGDAYLKMNDNADALDAYQKSLQINPNNTSLQAQVDNLRASGATAPPPNSNAGQWEESQPTTVVKTVVVERPYRRPRPQPVNYNDGLNVVDHAKVWTKVGLGYAYSQPGDLSTSADSWNNDIKANGWTGSATSPNYGLDLAFELGFLINPNNGLAIGLKYVSLSDYNLNVNFQNGPTSVAGNLYDSDFDQLTLSPYILPLTLDYYLFLPDSTGRFYLTAGGGYYFSTIHVNRSYSYVIQNNDPTQTNNFTGDLHSGGLGFEFGIGREWAISPNMGFVLFADGRYAKITNFTGTITDGNGNTANVGLATDPNFNNEVFVDDTTRIGGASGTHYSTIDFTGFDVGLALTFYSF
jgi:tetratricopeptide (TPR) repeat protein